ncbi:chromosome partitioning protein, ParB family [Brevinema andersonii]|uniref:Chromosome partitioning protein, ParB family n=1 Tax=Brevinema andersonii TaxID=34097 RepID=A0A1I1D5Z6_BREAD|nr:ParB N-terminal domain-containing protein [Brevinema andersonii]SFB68033.1 chromosome partitioning protein, ParB family [Brevinema andersonii]
MKIGVEKIIVKERIRKDLGNLEPLKNSLSVHGQLHPIVITTKNVLISGERRLTAAKELGWQEIDVLVKDIDPETALAIELEENITRRDFNAEELSNGLKKQKKMHNNIFYKIAHFFKNIVKRFLKKT